MFHSLNAQEHINLSLYTSVTTGQTPSADEDHVMRSKATEQIGPPCCEIV